MHNDIAHVKPEFTNTRDLAEKDVTTTSSQRLDIATPWMKFMNEHLAGVERYGKDWLEDHIAKAEKFYATHMTTLTRQLA